MDSSHIRPWQARRMNEMVRPILGYLSRLQRRMEKRRFPPGDPLYKLVCTAYDAIHGLHIWLHYRSCEGNKAFGPKNELRDRPPDPLA